MLRNAPNGWDREQIARGSRHATSLQSVFRSYTELQIPYAIGGGGGEGVQARNYRFSRCVTSRQAMRSDRWQRLAVAEDGTKGCNRI